MPQSTVMEPTNLCVERLNPRAHWVKVKQIRYLVFIIDSCYVSCKVESRVLSSGMLSCGQDCHVYQGGIFHIDTFVDFHILQL